MDVWHSSYEKPEVVSISEQLHKLKSKKADVELELSEQKFKFRYIPQRREIAEHQARNLLCLVIPISLVILAVIALFFVVAGKEQSALIGTVLLAGGLFAAFGGYADFIFLRQLIPLLKLLSKSRTGDRMREDTIEGIEKQTKERIDYLEKEIGKLDREIAEKAERQAQLVEEQKHRESILREKGILYDANPNTAEKGSSLSLKDSSNVGAEEAARLYEYYQREEEYIIEYIRQLQGKLSHVNRELVEIDEEFERMKKRLFISGIVFLLVVLIQSQFSGWLQNITAVVCMFCSFAYICYLERVCKRPLLNYLIEHDSIFTKEYAFCRDAVPVSKKRMDVMEQIDNCEKELADIRQLKEQVAFS